MSGGENDASSRSDSDFESTRLAARKHTRRKPHSESESEQNTDSERPIKKKRKQKAVRELPGRSARPVTYKDGSSEDDGSEMADDEDVSICKPQPASVSQSHQISLCPDEDALPYCDTGSVRGHTFISTGVHP